MSAHLTLISDRSGEVRDQIPTDRTGVDGRDERSRRRALATHWVHTLWVPKPPSELRVPRLRALSTRATSAEKRFVALGDDRGAVTAEYAIVILAGVAFAGLLVAILRSDEVRQVLVDLVQNALGSAG
ncbi:DUF4244 domain-containing protein [Leucobacter soli]|uniref:DUF4244 domain-containing protein n=1 Tax=Leucobacter soli TaxID=2812850 RepID=A0A916K0E9_9MICO|nr:DUF4244 domain-containing protein [Leucobacter soli]CAG7617283.1 hypothetical protein LEUCIP111803_02083 [Leucobacter soli]